MSALTKLDERIDEMVFALRSAVEASYISTQSDGREDEFSDDQAWGHVRKQLFRLVDELLK